MFCKKKGCNRIIVFASRLSCTCEEEKDITYMSYTENKLSHNTKQLLQGTAQPQMLKLWYKATNYKL